MVKKGFVSYATVFRYSRGVRSIWSMELRLLSVIIRKTYAVPLWSQNSPPALAAYLDCMHTANYTEDVASSSAHGSIQRCFQTPISAFVYII